MKEGEGKGCCWAGLWGRISVLVGFYVHRFCTYLFTLDVIIVAVLVCLLIFVISIIIVYIEAFGYLFKYWFLCLRLIGIIVIYISLKLLLLLMISVTFIIKSIIVLAYLFYQSHYPRRVARLSFDDLYSWQ